MVAASDQFEIFNCIWFDVARSNRSRWFDGSKSLYCGVYEPRKWVPGDWLKDSNWKIPHSSPQARWRMINDFSNKFLASYQCKAKWSARILRSQQLESSQLNTSRQSQPQPRNSGAATYARTHQPKVCFITNRKKKISNTWNEFKWSDWWPKVSFFFQVQASETSYLLRNAVMNSGARSNVGLWIFFACLLVCLNNRKFFVCDTFIQFGEIGICVN